MSRVDVVLHIGLVNLILGLVYTYVTTIIGLLIYEINKSDVKTYQLIMSKKSIVVGFKYCVLITCATAAYQNFFGDFSPYLLWWRVALISLIGGAVTKWYLFSKRINKEFLNNGFT